MSALSYLTVAIRCHGDELRDVPFPIEVDGTLSGWLRPFQKQVFQLAPGMHLVGTTLPSGRRVEKPIALSPGSPLQPNKIDLDLSVLSPHESHEWAHVTKLLNPESPEGLDEARFASTWIRLWRLDQSAWMIASAEKGRYNTWHKDGVTYTLQVPHGMHVLQVGGPRIAWKLVALPSASEVRVLVRPVAGPAGAAHPLEVTVSGSDGTAEEMLGFLTTGSMFEARQMVANVTHAQDMLFRKREQPSSAAVGGYYLLRIGALDRLRGWARNLATWIDWMPDGCVIRAWQLIRASRKRPEEREDARRLLIEGVRRGMPIYTEGLRLLRDGLRLFHRARQGEDRDVCSALERVEAHTSAADWSCTTTTFTGTAPDAPSAASVRGIPQERGHLGYLYDVPLQEMVRTGALTPGTRLKLGRHWASISDRGIIVLADGREFNRAQEAARAIRAKPGAQWTIGRTYETLEDRGYALREGMFAASKTRATQQHKASGKKESPSSGNKRSLATRRRVRRR